MSAEPTSLLTMLPLLIICCLAPMLCRGGMGGAQRTATYGSETDVFISPQKIDDTFEAIHREVNIWREEAKAEPPPRPSILPFGQRKMQDDVRFNVRQSITPRLYRVGDRREGEIVFELTEIENDGTSVRVSYSPPARNRVQTFKAQFPARIPSDWQSCPYCTKPVRSDFTLCPYCGYKLKEQKE